MAPNHMSRGDWAACEECHRFIEAREMGQLADRSVRTFQERHGELPRSEVRALRRQLVGVHQQFLKARTGPAVSVP